MVPRQIGCSGVTAWRRLREWQRAGVWERLHRELLRRLNAQGYIHVLSSYSGHSSLGPV
jgi:transposase